MIAVNTAAASALYLCFLGVLRCLRWCAANRFAAHRRRVAEAATFRKPDRTFVPTLQAALATTPIANEHARIVSGYVNAPVPIVLHENNIPTDAIRLMISAEKVVLPDLGISVEFDQGNVDASVVSLRDSWAKTMLDENKIWGILGNHLTREWLRRSGDYVQEEVECHLAEMRNTWTHWFSTYLPDFLSPDRRAISDLEMVLRNPVALAMWRYAVILSATYNGVQADKHIENQLVQRFNPHCSTSGLQYSASLVTGLVLRLRGTRDF